MWDLLSRTWRLLLVPLFALGFFLGAYFFFYRGGYDPPPTIAIPFEDIVAPSSSFSTFTEVAPIQSGLLLFDGTHRNGFFREEITALLARVADRGYAIEFTGETDVVGRFLLLHPQERLFLLEEKLRGADSFAVIIPGDSYFKEEVDIVERFVSKGGKLLLIADPTRSHDINSLAKRFGIAFRPDYLYNTTEYDINFQDIFVRSFLPDEITGGLSQIVLYTAGSIDSSGTGLAATDGNTRSSLTELTESFYPMVRGADGHVVAVSDLTFMVPPQNSIMDNNRLISNLADFLTVSDRRFELADFPHFFKEDVDILIGNPALVNVATDLKSLLSTLEVGSQIRGIEDLNVDTAFLGLYEDSAKVVQYLDVAGIQVGDTVRTPFTSELAKEGTAVVLLNRTKDRYVLVVLADSPRALADMVRRLRSGAFREGLVDDFVGVFENL